MSSVKAPEGFTEIWSKDVNNGSNGTRTEKLFVQDKFAMKHSIAKAEASTETNPTDAQKEAGNYKKGHVKIDGFDFTVENPKGSERSGKDADGKPWSVTMNNTYGYIRGTVGVDGDHIDMFLSENPEEGKVYVIDQVNADGSFDEHKVMYGFNSEEEARSNYLANYSKGWTGLGNITEVSKEQFKKWIDSSHRKTKPFSEYKGVKVGDEQQGSVKHSKNKKFPKQPKGEERKRVSSALYDLINRYQRENNGEMPREQTINMPDKIYQVYVNDYDNFFVYSTLNNKGNPLAELI